MSINLEQIEMLRERANVTYGEAKETLEKCNNNILEALIFLENQAKLKAPKKEDTDESGIWSGTKKACNFGKKLIKKGNKIRFVIKKEEGPVVNLPLNIVILTTIFMTPLTVVGLTLALVTGHKLRLVNPDGGEGMEINKTFDKISTVVSSVSDQVVEAIKKE